MTPADVVIVGPYDARQTDDLAGRKFWYFGNDYAQLLEIQAGLPASASTVSVGDLTNAVAGHISLELIELDARLFSGRYLISWISSDLAERSPYISSFYLECCRCIALIEALRSDGKHFVVVGDPEFGKALAAVCGDNGLSAQWRGHGAGRSWWRKAARAHGGFLMRWFAQRRAGRLVGLNPSRLAACDPLLMTWAERETVTSGKDAEDRYFRMLPAWLRETGANIGWLYNPVHWLHSTGVLNTAAAKSSPAEPDILVGRFFGPGALVRAYASLFAFPFAVKRHLTINGINLTQLVRLAVKRELASSRLVAAALYANIAAALRRAGVVPRHLIYTFENQPWEKAMLTGFRRTLPATKLIGIQHASIAERYLSGHPSHKQWVDGTAPDLLVTIGPEFCERLVVQGAPESRVIVGGALRYADLISSVQDSSREPKAAKLVLATCSMEIQDSLELAHKAAVATAKLPGVRLAINFHPMADAAFRDAIQNRLTKTVDCSHVDFVAGGAAQWLKQADILLYNSSSTCFEAAAVGLPMVYVGSDTALDLDNMSGAAISRARSPDELRRHITQLLNDTDHRKNLVKAAQDYLRRCFSTPSRNFWIALSR